MAQEEWVTSNQFVLSIFGWSVTVIVLLINLAFTYFQSRKIEKLRAGFRKGNIEYEVRFGKYHEKKIETLVSLHANLVEVEIDFQSLMAPIQSSDLPDKEKKADVTLREFRKAARNSYLFLKPKTKVILKEIEDVLHEAAADYVGSKMTGGSSFNIDAWRLVSEKIPFLKGQIEEEFRGILKIGNVDKV